jgi:hypothetical protein
MKWDLATRVVRAEESRVLSARMIVRTSIQFSTRPPSSTPPSPTSPLHPIALAMFLQRSAVVAARRVAPRAIARRAFSTTIVRRTSARSCHTICH